MMVASRSSEQWLTRSTFQTPGHAMIETTFASWFPHASSRKTMSSSRPETSHPVTTITIKIVLASIATTGVENKAPTFGLDSEHYARRG